MARQVRGFGIGQAEIRESLARFLPAINCQTSSLQLVPPSLPAMHSAQHSVARQASPHLLRSEMF